MDQGDALKARLATEVVKIINDHELWELSVFVVGACLLLIGAGAFLSWWYKRIEHHSALKKALVEQEKLAVETANAKLETTLKRQKARKTHEEQAEILGYLLREWGAVVSGTDLARINEAREEVLNCFTTSYIPTFRDYTEIQFASLPKADRRMFAENEVLPFLRTTLNLLGGINYPRILARIQKEPLRLKRTTLCDICSQARRVLPVFPTKGKRIFERLCTGIAEHEYDL